MPLPPITRTVERKPVRAIIAGPAKVGKSTFASGCPKPIFIRSEDGTNGIAVDAFDVVQKWDDALDQLRSLAKEQHDYQTVVIDALDGLERLIWHHVAASEGKDSIEQIPYGKGYMLAMDQWQRLVAALTYLRDKRGMRSVLIAHTHQRRVSSPDLPEFERYEPRLHAKAIGLLTEWADLIGFARHETVTRETDGGKTQGVSTGRRLLYCAEAASYVAGNRYGITDPLPLTWSALAARIEKEPSNG